MAHLLRILTHKGDMSDTAIFLAGMAGIAAILLGLGAGI